MTGSCDRVDEASGVPTCGTCGYRTALDFTSAMFRLRKRYFDVSCCYDGAIIVSDRFRVVYQSLGGSNMHFGSLPATPGFYHLKCSKPVPLDYAAMGTTRSRLCGGCGRYLDVVGCTRIILGSSVDFPENELGFSDWHFGSNNEANPIVLCGAVLASAMQSFGLTGIDSFVQI
ncbi:hypothetical protein MMG85_17390 [Pseudoxanthomonas sp. LH2527]|uniref:hypothetical protein n=1 Tax=Pseudoxanthomonas sp. LH2527 TaxID=2923249 RepID=UPI001F146A41|nr:hypothetical protein [Pseudoxanthomonas sp. LH2527]MCH6485329.1 hypothetical protein [Pseudoxanthomonas sp. LH2527]